MRTSLLLAALFLLQTPTASLDQVLASVSRNVREFQDLLPDFVCNEKITSTAYESGKLKETRTVESIFTAVHKPSPGPRGLLVFTETRDITAIDGIPARKGARMPKLPAAMFGGFGALLSMTFSPENLQYHQYERDGVLDGDARIVIRFTTTEGQRELRTFLDGEGLINRDKGVAWIDSDSMQVVRLQRDFFSLPRTLRQLRNTVDYGSVMIGDRQFWLPRSMRTDVTDRDPRKTKTFLAEYTNCKRFTAEIKIEQ
jgi:hypothetical protein